jgi:vacuolar-type H+-ATPase subunit I/STV1
LKSSRNNSEESYNFDEIPGLTTWIYSENRPREPHEFINAWKDQPCEKAARTLDSLDLNQDLTYVEVVELLEGMFKESERLQNQYDTALQQLKDEQERHKEIVKKLNRLQIQAEKFVEREQKKVSFLTDMVTSYGAHKGNCGYIELIHSGRIVDISEGEACTCGFSENLALAKKK